MKKFTVLVLAALLVVAFTVPASLLRTSSVATGIQDFLHRKILMAMMVALEEQEIM